MKAAEIEKLKEEILEGKLISLDEANTLAKTEALSVLLSAANEIRQHFCGNAFDLCSITNARSGKCGENCKWCSQSVHYPAEVEKYELVDRQEVMSQAKKHAADGVHQYSLVTSGKTISDGNLDQLLDMYREMKQKTALKLCASMGLLNRQQLRKLKEAGVEHYHCNLETARSNFQNLCTTHTYEEKVDTIKIAMEEGLRVCSGGIIGMGESLGQRIEMAIDLRELGVQSIPINILNPIIGTPLEYSKPLSDDEILKTFAIFRFIQPAAKIRFAGGRLQIRHLQDKLLHGGVNAALVGDLLTTIGSDTQQDMDDFEAAGFSVNHAAD